MVPKAITAPGHQEGPAAAHQGALPCLTAGGTAASSHHGIPRSAPRLEPVTVAALSFYGMKLY